MSQPTRAEMIAAAVAMLRGGLLHSALPRRLMAVYGLTREAANELAARALVKWRGETKPLNTGGNGEKKSKSRRQATINSHPPDSQIITRAVELLQGSLLPGVLPQKLMDEFGLSAEHADDLATVAIRRKQKQTKPIERLGE
jgi:hypothetical protein